MSKLRIALLQLLSDGYDQAANLAKGQQYCRMARQLGADIALFPEMWNIGYQLPDTSLPEQVAYWQQHAIARDSDFINSFRKLAWDQDLAIGLTYLEQWPGGPRNNIRWDTSE